MKYDREEKHCCYFHPKEVFVGVCPLCLNERLVILASKQGHLSHRTLGLVNIRKPPSINFSKIFAFGSFLNRLEFRHWKSHNNSDHDDDKSTSPEDSFISIKFENNGKPSWEKSKVSLHHCTTTKDTACVSVIEHAKPRASLRWRKKIGHLFQLIRWKRSNNHVEGVEVMRKGWIRGLTKRKVKDK